MEQGRYRTNFSQQISNSLKKIGFFIFIFSLGWRILHIVFEFLDFGFYFRLLHLLGGWQRVSLVIIAAIIVVILIDTIYQRRVEIIIQDGEISIIKPKQPTMTYRLDNADFFLRENGDVFFSTTMDCCYMLQILDSTGYMHDVKCYGFDKRMFFYLKKELEGKGLQRKNSYWGTPKWM